MTLDEATKFLTERKYTVLEITNKPDTYHIFTLYAPATPIVTNAEYLIKFAVAIRDHGGDPTP
jgi:hypothetical protein